MITRYVGLQLTIFFHACFQLKVVNINFIQAPDSCSPHPPQKCRWTTTKKQPPQLTEVSCAHTRVRHSTDNKMSWSSSASASTVAQSMKTQLRVSIGSKLHEGQTHKLTWPAARTFLPPNMTRKPSTDQN